MTVLGVKNQLIDHFLSNDIFDPKVHPFEVTYDLKTADFREELLNEALGQLEAAGLVKKLSKPDHAIWVLNVPVNALTQQVELTLTTAHMVAEIVNEYNDMEEINWECGKLNINEIAIARLVDIIQHWEDSAAKSLGHDKDDDEEGELDDE